MNERPPGSGKRRAFVVLGIVAVIILGAVSSLVSLPAVERATALRIVGAMPKGRKFFVQHDEAGPERLAVWNAIGANYRVHDPQTDGPEHFPWGSCGRASSWLPFLASVRYRWVREPQVGGGGDLWYFCCFGLVFELGHSTTRAS